MLDRGRSQPGHGTPRNRSSAGNIFAKELATDVAQNGTIKRLVMDRGFGFLSGEDGKEYFFHRSSVEGPRASRVRVA